LKPFEGRRAEFGKKRKIFTQEKAENRGKEKNPIWSTTTGGD